MSGDSIASFSEMSESIMASAPSSPQPHTSRDVSYYPTINTNNRYSSLDSDQALYLTHNGQSSVQKPSPKCLSPPPIFVYTNNTKETLNILSNCCKHKYSTKLNDHLSIKATDINDQKLIVESLKARKIEFFTYDAKKERPLKIVIKYVPTDLDIHEIADDLRVQGLSFISATFVKQKFPDGRRNKIPLILLYVAKTSVGEFYQKLNYVLKVNISVEPYSNKHFTQCCNCQQVNNSSACCHLIAKCVKCGEQHPSRDCKKSKDTAIICANCGNEHTANYRGCPA